MSLHRPLVATLVGTSALLASIAYAAPASSPMAHLTYERNVARDDCPDERAFRALVTARLGHDPFAELEGRSVRVRVTSDASRIVGRVEITEEGASHQERTVRGAAQECEAVVEALASVVALNLMPPTESDGNGAVPLPPLPAPPTAPPDPLPSPRALGPRVGSETTQRAVDDSSPPVRFGARGALVTSFGLLPGAAIGGEIGAGFDKGWFSLFAMGRAEAQPVHATGALGEHLDGSVLSGGLLPCFSATWFTACGVAWIGVLQGRAPDAERPSLGSSTVGFAGARVSARLRLGASLHFTPQVEVWVPVVRTTLVYAETATWTAPAFLGSFGLGLVYVPKP